MQAAVANGGVVTGGIVSGLQPDEMQISQSMKDLGLQNPGPDSRVAAKI